MGWFSNDKPKIEVKEKSSWGTIKWVGKCPECGKEHSDTDKKSAIKKIERCQQSCERKAKVAAEDAEEATKRKMAQKGRELRRLAKGKKCPFCGHKVCKGTKPKCVNVIAARWESGTVDTSDPGNYDDQLKWYRDNLE